MTRRIVAVIPARLGSHRLPRKMLLPLDGRPLLEHVWRRLRRCRRLDGAYIATDSLEIARCAEAFGAPCLLTSKTCPSGTDRVMEALGQLRAWGAVNVQGDEPFVSPAAVDRLAESLRASDGRTVYTLARPYVDHRLARTPDSVKVVRAADGRAIYFSRSAVPFAPARDAVYHEHVGVYAYPRSLLKQFVTWGPSPLERRERLEQLRFLEHGIRIQVITTTHQSLSIDTAADLRKAAARLRRNRTW
jgi:3-deoxy-manno-octulosonate cytidylyltransferase (CMP-KDO synthetase)